MRIAWYFIGWNIAPTVAMTVRHYKQFCEKVVFLDNHSTDGSWNEALRAGAECQLFGKPGILDDGEYIKIKNNVWKGSDFDYVGVSDDDEILYHPTLKASLQVEKTAGTTMFRTQGYSIFSPDVPRENWIEIKTGYEDHKYSKLVLFDPKAIKEIDYIYGCHQARPVGDIRMSKGIFPLLHYMGVGGPERMIARHQMYAKRLSPLNERWGLGIEYRHTPESKRQWYAEQLAKSGPLYWGGTPLFGEKPLNTLKIG